MITKRAVLRLLLLLLLVPMPGSLRAGAGAIAGPAAALVYHAAQSGRETLDEDAAGGNPFATAFVETLAGAPLDLAAFDRELRRLTRHHSDGYQEVDGPPPEGRPGPAVGGSGDARRRVALVIVLADYGAAQGIASLPGARFDAARVAAALRRAGYDTDLALDLPRADFLARLDAFRTRSAAADQAILYTTGHGVEIDGTVHLIGNDFPLAQGRAALAGHAVTLPRMVGALAARSLNLALYAGCRNQPF